MDPLLYEALLADGYRRSGRHFYRTRCDSCSQCIPLRIKAADFIPSPTQRKILRKNTDIQIQVGKIGLYRNCFQLYERYVEGQHGKKNSGEDSLDAYYSFLIDTGLGTTALSSYFLDCPEESRLVANGYLDILPNGISSVYFAWEPACAKRSLGVFSVLKEIELCVKLKKDYYYLGFWVPLSPTMEYKANYSPAEVALEGSWRPLTYTLKKELQARFIDT